MNNVNSNGDKVSNQNQKNGGQSIVPGTAVGELKGKNVSLNMEEMTPQTEFKQTERNGTHLPPDQGLKDNNVLSERRETEAIVENSRDEKQPIVLHPDIQHNKEKGAIPKKDVGKSMHKTEIVDIIRKRPNKMRVDEEPDKYEIQSNLERLRGSVDNMLENIDEEVDIFIRNKNKEDKKKVIKVVMKYISACLNTDGGIVKLNNRHFHKASGKDLDEWYGDIEKQLFNDSTKFITFEGKYYTEILYLHIKPLHYIFSVDTYLYFPRNTDIVEAKYEQAIDILRISDKSGSLTELQAVEGDFECDKTHSTLSENDQIQFKEITSKNIPGTFSSMINKYISAFSNHKGGRIIFGIEDKKFKVVGVELTEEDKKSITNLMYDKMENTMKWGCDKRTYVYGKHWSIDFLPVKNIGKPITTGKTLEVIMVSVCRYPGGVFTDTPKAYYIREVDRTIQQFTFQEWKTKMVGSDKGVENLLGPHSLSAFYKYIVSSGCYRQTFT